MVQKRAHGEHRNQRSTTEEREAEGYVSPPDYDNKRQIMSQVSRAGPDPTRAHMINIQFILMILGPFNILFSWNKKKHK